MRKTNIQDLRPEIVGELAFKIIATRKPCLSLNWPAILVG